MEIEVDQADSAKATVVVAQVYLARLTWTNDNDD